MRYCLLTFVLAYFAAAIGCQTPLQKAQPEGAGFRGAMRGPCVQQVEPAGPGAVPYYFHGQYSDCASAGGQAGSDLTSQVQFLGPEGMVINYNVSQEGAFDSESLTCPCIHNFKQEAVYRLKLSNIPNMLGRELYPTIEIAPTFARSAAFLSHNMIPIEFTDNDFDQVFAGNFITKVIYLPNPEFQGLATAGVGTLVNTQLEPGVDPVVEAECRGTILAVVRIGNKDMSNAGARPISSSNYSNGISGEQGSEMYQTPTTTTADDFYGATRLPNAPQLVGRR